MDATVVKGKLHETVLKYPMTDIWMDSCGEEELNYGLERGITGATSNPIIIAAVIRKELPYWEPYIRNIIAENPTFSDDDITWALIDEVGRQRCKKLAPVFEKFQGKKGRLSIQTNAKFYRNPEKMYEQAVHLNGLGENMQVKVPASAAGLEAIEEATYQGVSINATVSFTVAQAIGVAEAIERGLKRRETAGLDTSKMSPVCTLMLGRTDDWLKESCQAAKLTVEPEALEWGGVAVFKEAYRIYKERGYRTRVLSAANRNLYHWSELVGGDVVQTINYGWQQRLEHCSTEVVSRIDNPVDARWMKVLDTLPEFHKAFDADGQKPEEFMAFGAARNTLSTFITGYEDLVRDFRKYLI